MTNDQMLIEANNRGLLTGQRKADFDNAVSRGLIKNVSGFAEEQAETFKNDVSRVGENLTELPTPKRAVGVAAEGLAEGIGGLFGLPVDAITSLLNSTFNLGVTDSPIVSGDPVGGSQEITESVRNVFRKFGVEPTQAELGNFTENLLQIGSASVAPGGAVLKGSQAASSTTKNPIVKSIANNPKEFITGEAVASTGGATGRTLAEQTFPESDTAGMVGELFGMPTASLIDAGIRSGKSGVAAAKNSFGEEGVLNNASKEIQGSLSGTPEDALKNLSTETSTPITPAKLSNDPGLIQSQREVNAQNASIELENQKLVMEDLTSKLESLQGGADGSEFVRQAKQDISDNLTALDDSVNQAAIRTQEELQNLNGATRQDASRLARANLDDAYNTQHLKESELWDAVNLDVPIKDQESISNISQALSEIATEGANGRAIPKDIIKLVDEFLYKRDFVKKSKTLNPELNVKTLQNLRSRVLAELRQASSGANPDANRSALLSKIQSALIEDMLGVKQTSPELTTAIAHSKRVNDVFNRGTVGKLRGAASDGSLRTDPDLTLSKLISKGEQGGVNLRDFLDADSSPQAKEAAGDYIQQLFLSDVAPDGQILDAKRANSFLNQYSFVLEQTPEVATRLKRAISTGDAQEAIGEQAMLSRKAIESSSLKTFLNIEDPKKAIKLIRSSKTPTTNLQSLVDAAKKDLSGNASSGLRTLVAEDILKSIQTKKTMTGSNVKELSNAKVQDVLTGTYRKSLEDTGLFDNDQLTLIDELVRDSDINQRTASAKISGTSGTSQDVVPSGAEIRGKVAKGFALRFIAPFFTKNAGAGSLSLSSMIGDTANKAASRLGLKTTGQLVERALTEDKELLKILLERVPTPKAQAEIVQKLRGHLISLDDRNKERENRVNVQKIGELTGGL